ncbi:hypothetical protein QYF36_019219 [Acer negundo]|nr:hypothetical protein QYF36_019219 [Acer negundo]
MFKGLCVEEVDLGTTSSTHFKDDLDEWFIDNLRNRSLMIEGLPHYLQFSCVVWFLWKWRCNKVFDHNYSVPQSPAVVINMLAKEWLKANFSTNERDEILMSIRWMKPNVDWVKLNVDGSRNSISGMITAGGVLRNH